MDASIILAKG